MPKKISIASLAKPKKKDIPRSPAGLVFEFEFETIPKGQPRLRHFLRKGNYEDWESWKKIGTYTPSVAKQFKQDISIAAINAGLKGKLLHAAIQVEMEFQMPRPQSHLRADGTVKPGYPKHWTESKPDLDNIEKALLDALTDTQVWVDDDLVCKVIKSKVYSHPDSEPTTKVKITTLENG